MARTLRIEIPGGRHHITARGNERKDIFWDDTDRFHFLELLADITPRFGARVHAYVLMGNHYHLLLETPGANLSLAMQWLNGSYCVWFNQRHRRDGHLLQGRFKSFVVENDAGWQEVARYVHLNPVRLKRLGLDKAARAGARAGGPQPPAPEWMAERLAELRQFRWSSYRGYAGYAAPLAWVWRRPLARLCGGRSEAEQQAALREYTEGAVAQGGLEPPWLRVVGGIALGSEAFAEQVRREAGGNPREQKSLRSPGWRVSWERIVGAVERAKGERWEEFAERRGDWVGTDPERS